MSTKALEAFAEHLADKLFELGSEPVENGKVQRIQFMAGKYPDNEIPIGGLNRTGLIAFFLDAIQSGELPVYDPETQVVVDKCDTEPPPCNHKWQIYTKIYCPYDGSTAVKYHCIDCGAIE